MLMLAQGEDQKIDHKGDGAEECQCRRQTSDTTHNAILATALLTQRVLLFIDVIDPAIDLKMRFVIPQMVLENVIVSIVLHVYSSHDFNPPHERCSDFLRTF